MERDPNGDFDENYASKWQMKIACEFAGKLQKLDINSPTSTAEIHAIGKSTQIAKTAAETENNVSKMHTFHPPYIIKLPISFIYSNREGFAYYAVQTDRLTLLRHSRFCQLNLH